MNIGQFHGDTGKIWTLLSKHHEFEFDIDGTLISVMNLNGEDATKEEVFEAIEYYDSL